MTSTQVGCVVFVALVLAGGAIWWLNEQLRPPAVRFARELAEETSRNDLVAMVLVALVWVSCSTCNLVETQARSEAYRACVARFTPDECAAVRP